MKNLSINVAATALIAFSLGFFARGLVERTPKLSEDTKQPTIHENITGPSSQEPAIARAGRGDEHIQSTASFDQEAINSTIDSADREMRVKHRRNMLGDFFVINGIGSYRAEQIVQGVVDADYNVARKQSTMLDRQTAEKEELIARGDVVTISHAVEERAQLAAESEALHRQAFGEYYEAYEIYIRSYPQRRVAQKFSSSLPEPLDYTTRETIAQIMYEEYSRFFSEQERKTAGSGTQSTSAPLGSVDETDSRHETLRRMRSYNDGVMDRTRAYLTPSQSEQLKGVLDNEVRRAELISELIETETPY